MKQKQVSPELVGMWVELGVCLLVIIFLFSIYDIVKPPNYPPGPCWLPVLGNLVGVTTLRKQLGFTHLVWTHLAAVYGPVVGLRLGRDLIVVVSTHDLVREVSIREDFDGRPDGFFFRLRSLGERLGVAFVDGPFYQEQKKFILKQLKEFGFGGRTMEQHIFEDTTQLIMWIKNQNGPILIQEAFDVSVLNSLWAMLTGSRLSMTDARLRRLLALLRESFKLLDMSGGLLNQIPCLRFILPSWSGYQQIVQVIDSINDFIRETITEHRNNLKTGVVNDFIDAFLHEMDNSVRNNRTSFSEKQLLILLLDMFMAGSETTSNTLAFTVLFLLKYPQVQEAAHKELDRVVESGKLPTLKDRPRLTYIEAIILESQRLGNVAPITPPHRAKKDTTLNGYTIPKNTSILINLYDVHMDSNYWEEPDKFRPERFLDDKGKIIQHDYFIPFGLGRRRCLGEALAKPNLFLFLASLLSYFEFSLAPGEILPKTTAVDGATLSPPHLKCVLKPRLMPKSF